MAASRPLVDLLAEARAALLNAPLIAGLLPAHDALHRSVPWSASDAEVFLALGDAEFTTELDVLVEPVIRGFVRLLPTVAPAATRSALPAGLSCSPACMGSRQRRRGLAPLSEISGGVAEGYFVRVGGEIWRVHQCCSRQFPLEAPLPPPLGDWYPVSASMAVAWDADDHASICVSRAVDDHRAQAVHEFAVLPHGFKLRIRLGEAMLPRSPPWVRCPGLLVAIPTSILVLVKSGHETLDSFWKSAGVAPGSPAAGDFEAAVIRAVALLCAAFVSAACSAEALNAAIGAIIAAVAGVRGKQYRSLEDALVAEMTGADAQAVFAHTFQDDFVCRMLGRTLDAVTANYDAVSREILDALAHPGYFALRCAESASALAAPSGGAPALVGAPMVFTGCDAGTANELPSVSFLHSHKTHSTIHAYTVRGCLAPAAASSCAAQILQTRGILGLVRATASPLPLLPASAAFFPRGRDTGSAAVSELCPWCSGSLHALPVPLRAATPPPAL